MKVDKMIQDGLSFFHIPHNEKTLNNLSVYTFELKKWNEHMNLTGFKELDCMVNELLYDAFFLRTHLNETGSVLDMGSGAGIPAIPISILMENLKVFSIDKSQRKIQFQRHIKRTIGLENFIPICSRAEDMEPMEVDILTAKGFGGIEEILKRGEKHIKAGGRAFILKGKNEDPVPYRGFELDDIIPYILPVSNKAYRLLIYKKN